MKVLSLLCFSITTVTHAQSIDFSNKSAIVMTNWLELPKDRDDSPKGPFKPHQPAPRTPDTDYQGTGTPHQPAPRTPDTDYQGTGTPHQPAPRTPDTDYQGTGTPHQPAPRTPDTDYQGTGTPHQPAPRTPDTDYQGTGTPHQPAPRTPDTDYQGTGTPHQPAPRTPDTDYNGPSFPRKRIFSTNELMLKISSFMNFEPKDYQNAIYKIVQQLNATGVGGILESDLSIDYYTSFSSSELGIQGILKLKGNATPFRAWIDLKNPTKSVAILLK